MEKTFSEIWLQYLRCSFCGQQPLSANMHGRLWEEVWKLCGQQATACHPLHAGASNPAIDFARLWSVVLNGYSQMYEKITLLTAMLLRPDYPELNDKFDALSKKVDALEEAIKPVQPEKAFHDINQEETLQKFDEIMEMQTTQFSNLVTSLSRFYGVEPLPADVSNATTEKGNVQP